MKLKTILPTFLFALLMFACSEDDSTPLDDREFVAGDVVIGIKSTTSISSVFDLMNEQDVTIDQMSGFYYYSTLSSDNLDYVISVLKDKPYLNKRGFKGGSAYVSAVDNKIVVTQQLFEMDLEAQQDWLETIELLELQNLGNDTKNLLIKVTPGTEKQWMKFFKSVSEVTWVELNYIGGFEPTTMN